MDMDRSVKEVFEGTRIVRRPVRGIVAAYHELPYRLVGPREDGSVLIQGTIRVSPRLVLTLRQLADRFGDIFEGDDGFMDQEIVARSFQFAVARDPNRSIRNEHLRIEPRTEAADRLLGDLEDQMARAEDTRTALLHCPNPRLYPISIDRFLREILGSEMQG
jgi:hypothetical protein